MDIREIRKEDLSTRVEWMNNPKIYRSMHFAIPVTIENTLKWYGKIMTDNSRVDVSFVDKEGALIAMGGLTHIDTALQKAELYIFVSPDLQGEGYGINCTALLCQYGFEKLGLHKIYLYTNANNKVASHIYEKIGFKLEGVLRDEVVENGIYSDRLYYGLLKMEFIMDTKCIHKD